MGILDNDDDYGIEQWSAEPDPKKPFPSTYSVDPTRGRVRGDMGDIMQGALSTCETELDKTRGAFRIVARSRWLWRRAAIWLALLALVEFVILFDVAVVLHAK